MDLYPAVMPSAGGRIQNVKQDNDNRRENMQDRQEMINTIEAVKVTQNRLAMVIGIGMGILLLVYFMTFSTLVDRGASGALWFQGITSMIFIALFFVLNRLCFQIALFRHGKRLRKLPWSVYLHSEQAGKATDEIVQDVYRRHTASG